MTATTSHKRRYAIAGGVFAFIAVGAVALSRFTTALGPIEGTVAPQFYVDSLATAQVPQSGPFVLVDAASARLYMIDDGKVQDSMKVIVGKPDSPTPSLKDSIYYETLNPYWHVTPDLTRSLIAANVLKLGPAYLTQHGYQVVSNFSHDAEVIPADSVDWKAVAAGDAHVQVRELPGPANSLGHYKFDLPNGDGIYLHDTPRKDLFAQDQRDLSHGCVRLEDAPRLAKWLLGKDPPEPSAPEQNVLLPHPVPITISYLDPKSRMQLASLR
ncbi:MAG TPA: L,D-transpeptidase family protein [Sphingomicrobium sp.]|nr:L,D-transpeptidase family protein [Sphingomicrobium sp.]